MFRAFYVRRVESTPRVSAKIGNRLWTSDLVNQCLQYIGYGFQPFHFRIK